jgi:manganese efflux pump family protein
MDFLYIFLIALGLSADCFAVCISAGATNQKFNRSAVLKVALAFGLAQFAMCVLGWLAGGLIQQWIAAYDHWVAFGLLAFVGGRMIWESFHEEEKERRIDISRGLLLITLAVATSIDSLAVGLSFALVQIDIWLSSIIIGVVAFLISIMGFWLGRKASEKIGKRAELIGGIILIIIGLRILLSHLGFF